MIGECEDCGEAASLRFKPCVPMDQQSRPSICNRCRWDREELAQEQAPGPTRGFLP